MQVVVDGQITNYLHIGKGPLVLMLHGWGDSGKTFAALSRQLSERYELVIPDLPGFDGQGLPGVWGLADYAGFVAAFLRKIDVDKCYAVVGHSNGGAIAIKALATETIHSDKLVLIASAGIRQASSKKTTYKVIAKVGKVATVVLPKKSRSKLRAKFYQSIGSDLLSVPNLEETFKKTVAEDIQVDASRVKEPTLLIYGAKDTATPPQYGEMLHERIADSELSVISNKGHFVHQEATAETTQLMLQFLQK